MSKAYKATSDEELLKELLSTDAKSELVHFAARKVLVLEKERDQLKAHISELAEEADNYLCQNLCGCGHPVCRKCTNDNYLNAVIIKTPKQSLAEIQAKAVEDFAEGCKILLVDMTFYEKVDEQEVESNVYKLSIEWADAIRANKLRSKG